MEPGEAEGPEGKLIGPADEDSRVDSGAGTWLALVRRTGAFAVGPLSRLPRGPEGTELASPVAVDDDDLWSSRCDVGAGSCLAVRPA